MINKVVYVLLLIFSFSCYNPIPCFEDEEAPSLAKFKNSSIDWHCGIRWWESDSSDLDVICKFLEDLTPTDKVSLRISSVIADIYFNGEESKTSHNSMRLSRSLAGEDVFHLGGYYYLNDEFVDYIIEALQITNLDEDLCDD